MGLTNLPSLDSADLRELALEILSFSGGENTISEDQVAKVNEARVIENWDANSLGGMVRSNGFNEVADGTKVIEPDVFTGSGLNDLTQGGTYTDTATATYTVIIDATGTPDTFKWKKNSGSFTTGVSITGAAQTLSDGVSVTFGATTGHTLNDQWVITAVYYTLAPDLLIQHKDTGGTAIYGVVEGDLVIKSSSSLNQEDANAFTSGTLCHGVSAGSALWITNATDNLKRKTVGVAIAAATGQPAEACARIYNHKNRLVAEGAATTTTRVYGSRVGTGNWNAANTWSLANDAWSVDLPATTRGCVPNFPSGNEVLAFTEDNCYALSNFPNTAYRPVSTPGRGCGAPYSIALGDEGVYFVSRRPTLGVFLYDGSSFTELTQYNKDVFVEKIDFTKRIYGIYRNRKYYLIYNETGSGLSYPNKMRVYDARFSRWMDRPVNSALADNIGYPAILQYSSNELYAASSRKDKVYELETTDNSDEGQATQAVYTTKVFSSRDFAVASGGQFPIDDVKIKLTKVTITYFGTVGSLGLQWSADRGLHSGSKTINLTANGDQINTTFIINSSLITSTPPDKTITVSFPNDSVGYRFQFTISNSGTSTLPRVKKIKIHAVAIDEQ